MKLKNICLFLCLCSIALSCGKDDSPNVIPDDNPPSGTPKEENKAPVIAEQSFTVAEDITDAQNIGTVTATDPNGDSLTFSIEMDDDGLFDITDAGVLSLTAGKSLDFETKTEHTLFVSAEDGELETNAKVTVTVQNVSDTLAEDINSFVTTWKTTEDGESITIGLVEYLTYDFTIDWGDGTVEDITDNENIAHSYAAAGDHVVAILGDFPGIAMLGFPSAPKLISIDQWGNSKWEFLNSAFMGCENMVYKAPDAPDLSQVLSLSNMFRSAKKFNGDIGDWKVSTIEKMNGMFQGASSFNQNIGGWNTENVTDMSFMFNDASSFNGNIGNWNVSSVTTMRSMFSGASAFNQDISGWNTKNVTAMLAMFSGASDFDQDIGGWNIGNITNMENMFNNSGMSKGSMENTLVGWDNFVKDNGGPTGITCGMENITVCGPGADMAVDNLEGNGWVFPGLDFQLVCE
ncbi:BspA family leucine-rich repeat surface protein [Flagellimonas sp. HMM57]|uniref:BspA family leucine-rich repeat surface protein n=1 Tax=unclassified Flagellimonas TaxID=2644544 RepID=UPI0013CFA252|nr:MULTISPECIES: BspA family leucine-rich repeat surface protein [unclassified Flagellimonas]UII75050.1 BspA family leucine-rich repeat surface protein [Flagellimonas sp. HMM57]